MGTKAKATRWLLGGVLVMHTACAPETRSRRAADDGLTETARHEQGAWGSAGGPSNEPAIATTATGGRSSLGTTPPPCEIAAVLSSACQGCHAADPGLQAPMALVSREDLLAPSVSDPARPVYELMLERVHDELAPMPPPPGHRLPEDALRALDAMAVAGPAEASVDGCGVAAGPTPALAAPAPEEIDTCYRVAAHGQAVAGDSSPHLVESGEHYSCFYFDIPWQAGAQALTVRSQPGPAAHHIELFHMNDAEPSGSIRAQQPDCGFAPRAPLLIWGLGQRTEQPMPEGVGLALLEPAAGRGLMLEIHYFNPGAPIDDQSQVEICTARTPRPQVAAITAASAGYFVLPPGQETVVHGNCTPSAATDIHIFRSIPHMHARGRRFQAGVTRADGRIDPFLDAEFDVNSQRSYDLDAVMHPGDRLSLDCHYMNDTTRSIPLGTTRDDEMCNHFVYAWPAGALSPLGAGTEFPCTL